MTRDLMPDAAEEVSIRQDLALIALGWLRATRVIEVARLFAAYAGQWLTGWKIVMASRRVASVGSVG